MSETLNDRFRAFLGDVTIVSRENHCQTIDRYQWESARDSFPEMGKMIGDLDIPDWERYMRIVISLLGGSPFKSRRRRSGEEHNRLLFYVLYYIFLETNFMSEISMEKILKFTYCQYPFHRPFQILSRNYRNPRLVEDLWCKVGLTPFQDYMSTGDIGLVRDIRQRVFRGLPRNAFYDMIKMQDISLCEWFTYLIRNKMNRLDPNNVSWKHIESEKLFFMRSFYKEPKQSIKNFMQIHRYQKFQLSDECRANPLLNISILL